MDAGIEIRDARPEEVEDVLPLLRAYCEFYESDPPDEGLREMARALIGACAERCREREGCPC